jgi:hypothetical protein
VSKWAEIDSKWHNEVHTLPIDPEKLPARFLRDAAYGHVPFINCHCKPYVSFSDDGEYVMVDHRDPERGSCTADGKSTLQ